MAAVREFVNTIVSHSVFSLVTLPMRTTCSMRTLPDNYLTNEQKLLHNSKTYIIETTLSDHFPILLATTVCSMLIPSGNTRSSRPPRRILMLNDCTKEAVLSELCNIQWNNLLSYNITVRTTLMLYGNYMEIVSSTLLRDDTSLSQATHPSYNQSLYYAVVNRSKLHV